MRFLSLSLDELKGFHNFKPEKQLVDSIKANGILVPVLVRKNGTGYIVIDGKRRVNAVKELSKQKSVISIESIPAIVFDEDEPIRYEYYSLIANVIRSQNRKDELSKVQHLIDEGLSIEEISEETGIPKKKLQEYIKVLNNTVPELIDRFYKGEIAYTSLKDASKLDKERQKALSKKEGRITKEDIKNIKAVKQQELSDFITDILEGAEQEKIEIKRNIKRKVRSIISKYIKDESLLSEIEKELEDEMDKIIGGA